MKKGNFLPQVTVSMKVMNATFPLVTNELIKKCSNVCAFYVLFSYLDRVTLFNYDFGSI